MTKIDDAMIERAAKAAYEDGEPKSGTWEMAYDGSRDYWRKFIRAALEAALTPQQPEIPVSEGMLEAGRAAWLKSQDYSIGGLDEWKTPYAAAYRAMERVRRKEAGQGPERRSGKDRRVNPRQAWWQSAGPTPWAMRGDEGRGPNRGRRKTDQ